MIRVAVNGFGRIGKLAVRLLLNIKDVEVVAINNTTDTEGIAYNYKYDSVHRTLDCDAKYEDGYLIVDGKKIKVVSDYEAENLPWKELDIDLVYECTGAFTKYEDAYKHIKAGAKKVLISAPGKGDMKTIVYGVNDNILDGSEEVVSAASCTTNCLAPVLKCLDDEFGVVKGFMSTIHAFTNDQETLDRPHKKGIYARRGRAASLSIIPTTTGAASAIGKVLPNLEGKLDGNAFRVPTPDGSLVDLTVELKKNVTKEEVNEALKKHSNYVLKYTDDPVVGADVIGNVCGSLVDGALTNVVEVEGRQLVKVVAWYDNEMGYTAQMIRTGIAMFR